jgi:hypothetical protein
MAAGAPLAKGKARAVPVVLFQRAFLQSAFKSKGWRILRSRRVNPQRTAMLR